MNSKLQNQPDFKEFSNLIEELEAPETRPYAPKLAADYKTGLRYKLLQQYEGKHLSHGEMFNLWRFAGTMTVILVLLFALASFVALLSNPATQTGPPKGIGAPATRTPAADPPVDITKSVVVFGDRVQLVGYQIEPGAEGTTLRLSWLPIAILDGKFHLFVHLIDENDNLALQVDTPVSDVMPLISREVKEIVDSELTLHTHELPNGRYNIQIGLYNTETGVRLPVTSLDNELIREAGSAVMLTNKLFGNENAGSRTSNDLFNPQSNVSSNLTNVFFGDGIQLEKYILEEKPDSLQLTLFWHFLDNPVDAHHLFIHVQDSNGTLISQMSIEVNWEANLQFAQTFAMPFPEEGLNNPYHIMVGFVDNEGRRLPASAQNLQRVVDDGTAIYLTKWEFNKPGLVTVSADRIHELVLFDAPAGDPFDIILDENIELILPTGSDKTVLYINDIGWASLQWRNKETGESDVCWVSEEIYDRIVDFANYLGSISTEENAVWLISAIQKERPSADAPIELEITLGYNFTSDEEVFLKISAAHPQWQSRGSNGRVPIDSLANPIFLNADENSVTIKAVLTPAEAQQILDTEQPVLVAEMGYLITHDDIRGNEFKFLDIETFVDNPVDFSTTEEIMLTGPNQP